MDYEIKLTTSEQRKCLLEIVTELNRHVMLATKNRRGLRPSEKAMNVAAAKRRHIAVCMAVDRLDAS